MITASCPFVFCEKLLGYFSCLISPKVVLVALPRLAAKPIPLQQGEAEIWGRFGQESRRFGQQREFQARYANCARPHKHWRFRISLI